MENTILLGPMPTLNFGGDLILPTYPLFISALFTILVFYINRRSRTRGYSGSTALDLFLYCVVGGSLGARILHVIYEAPSYYIENPFRIFYFWQGGFVFYGGLLSGVFAGWLYVYFKKQSFRLWLDFATPVLSLGYALGRWACFLAGCCYGQLCDLPWAVSFKQINTLTNITSHVHRHPTQLYASGLEFLLLFLVLRIEKKNILQKKPGHLFFLWLALHSISRILVELFRDDDRGAMFGALSISMFISFILISISFVVLFRGKSSKTPNQALPHS